MVADRWDRIGTVDAALLAAALSAKGFMPEDEGLALHEAGLRAAAANPGRPLLEIGSYCGKSAIYLGAAARAAGAALFTVDHHRGSEENQPGWEHHDPSLVEPGGRMDTLPTFRRTIAAAGLEDVVVAVVGESTLVARHWRTPLALLFVDGGHGQAVAWADYRAWTPKIPVGGLLAIHDVFADPQDGGRPPYELFCDALASGAFVEARGGACGSLRVLERVNPR
ncbi:MAG: class I SAM-dependent methyltransferase [Actinobacteria bacterium]|nr:class I SAM-dependent methyltransferase [Actinomycetota bacterium]MBW3650965.1 class I SAM-dependent methyltransferase [Actinomycetota bacterium]